MDLGPDDTPTGGLRRYLRAVAVELGLAGQCWRADPGPPVTAYLAVDGNLPTFPDRDLALLWDEEYGWAAAVRTAPTDSPVVLTYCGGDVLPAPPSVADYVAALRRGDHPGDPRPIRLRAYGTPDDLTDRLRAYAQ
ncbi:hypothetical protein B0I31_10428 [Saccharothrix carnea]|uniref:DUF6292 domain-containing protein n=1 Tax=Saccharothrix carnea TaxID=1280637 RepID=A0A2P8IBB7_SACCR|nr:DUF6292 family protein [Saccharothrix carnea]PSL55737.1 hypothetical protein B0I31_10428 [Saccharothrix carnea]